VREKSARARQECVRIASRARGRAHHGGMANDEDAQPVPVPHRREPAPRRLRAVAANDHVQAVVRVRLNPAASQPGFEQSLRTLACVVAAWRVTGDVDYELLVACRAVADLNGVLTCLRSCGGTEVASVGLVLCEVSGLGGSGRAGRLARAAGDGRFDGGHCVPGREGRGRVAAAR
jgi:DNA-binding Lrp family transcriptional regulator